VSIPVVIPSAPPTSRELTIPNMWGSG
jgi:hypothetical protein